MKKALLIAQWEFRSAVMRRAYLISVLSVPLLFGVIMVITAVTTRSAQRSSASTPVALVDRAGIVDVTFAAEQAARREAARTPSAVPTLPPAAASNLVAYPDLDSALGDLKARKVSAVYVIEADYLTTGTITTYGRDLSLFAQNAATQRVNQIGDAIRSSLMRKGLDGDELLRAYAPTIRINRLTVDAAGSIRPGDSSIGRFLGSFGVFMLLVMAILFSSGFLQQATIEDRQNRVFEILLSSVTPDELLIGKILGLGAAGLVQVAIYVVLLIVPGSTLFAMFDLPFDRLALSLVYFVLGYLLFASFMASTGMMGRTSQESAQMSVFWTMAATSPMFLMPSIMAAPNGTLARVLSFFPLSSPVTMLMRLTSSEVPAVDIVVSIAICAVSVYVSLKVTAKIFRAATLMYGKRPNLPELMRWIRA